MNFDKNIYQQENSDVAQAVDGYLDVAKALTNGKLANTLEHYGLFGALKSCLTVFAISKFVD